MGTDAGTGIAEGLCARIEAADAALAAFVRGAEPDGARRERLGAAERAVRERFGAPGGRPPLFCVPVAVKDVLRVDGLPTRAGSALPAEVFAGPQATAVDRLREAGALVAGKAVTAEFALGRCGGGRRSGTGSPGAPRTPGSTCGSPRPRPGPRRAGWMRRAAARVAVRGARGRGRTTARLGGAGRGGAGGAGGAVGSGRRGLRAAVAVGGRAAVRRRSGPAVPLLRLGPGSAADVPRRAGAVPGRPARASRRTTLRVVPLSRAPQAPARP
ncbi:amidase family protein [Kitasatospora sp. NPDC001540]|uniref:amidase family protein n=1 Tax=Kitasatospora sp. NPDC001540 TaxID=3364014 RepID=UPI0036AF535D